MEHCIVNTTSMEHHINNTTSMEHRINNLTRKLFTNLCKGHRLQLTIERKMYKKLSEKLFTVQQLNTEF